jgi:hypothetical protein
MPETYQVILLFDRHGYKRFDFLAKPPSTEYLATVLLWNPQEPQLPPSDSS